MKETLILASGSPQRKAILKELGIAFKAIPADIDEHHDGLTKPHAIVKSLAYRKADEIAKTHPNEWILGSDTLVILSDGRIAEKPKDRADAKRTIETYRDSYCDVYSGLALVNRKLKKNLIGFERTRLIFSDFTDAQIEEYLDSGEWKNRSGSMTIEGRGGKWINKVEGDYWNVVGLPVNLLKTFILQSDIDK